MGLDVVGGLVFRQGVRNCWDFNDLRLDRFPCAPKTADPSAVIRSTTCAGKAAFAGAAEALARPRAGPALELMTLARSSRKPRPAPNTQKAYTDFSCAYFHPPVQARNLRCSISKDYLCSTPMSAVSPVPPPPCASTIAVRRVKEGVVIYWTFNASREMQAAVAGQDCACAAGGHAAPPASSVTNSRRLK